MTPEITVCIVHWNTPDDLRTCLDALLSSTSAANLELVVIDNASLPDAIDAVQRDYPNITVVKNTINVGYAAGCNQAARIATGEMLLFLNPDARVEPAAIATLVMRIKTHPMTLAAPRLVWPDGRTQQAVTGVPDPMEAAPLAIDKVLLPPVAVTVVRAATAAATTVSVMVTTAIVAWRLSVGIRLRTAVRPVAVSMAAMKSVKKGGASGKWRSVRVGCSVRSRTRSAGMPSTGWISRRNGSTRRCGKAAGHQGRGDRKRQMG